MTRAGIILRGGIAQGGPDAEIQRPAVNEAWDKAKVDELCPNDMTRSELILRYTLSHSHCQTTIIGICDLAHLAENLAAARRGLLLPELVSEITARVAKILG